MIKYGRLSCVLLLPFNMFKPYSIFTDHSKAMFLLSILSCLCFMIVFVMLSCLFLAALWSPALERADLFVLLRVMSSSGFATFPYGA